LLTLVYHSATCGGRLGENFGDLGGKTAWTGRKMVEFFGAHPQGSVCGGKCFPAAGKQLPPVNSSTSRFLQREIIFFKGYSTFLCGGPKVPLPASQRPASQHPSFTARPPGIAARSLSRVSHRHPSGPSHLSFQTGIARALFAEADFEAAGFSAVTEHLVINFSDLALIWSQHSRMSTVGF
jgi:hypothetical protein